MNSPITTEVIRQALSWQGITVTHVRCLSAFEDIDHNTLADLILIFSKGDFKRFAENHGRDWHEVMALEFREVVESSFCHDFGSWVWEYLPETQEIRATVSFLLLARETSPAQLAFDDLSWLCDESSSPF